ncbi:MAG: hypothetical protein M1835_008144 [Candelina submexicana]|nr:MAG: hypothetical protein M1835_008144 [Candelina submexicana]
MRLFLLPISTRRTLIYCQRLNQQLSSELTYADKITSRAAATWVKWEKGNMKWQQTVTHYGNKAFKRIPFEEWGLKSIPPLSARKEAEELQGNGKVEVIFPGQFVEENRVGDVLRRIGTERKGLHTKWMWWSIVGMPCMAPVALIPIIPNIPFFYLAFRAWSHWRALSGSKHLEYILDKSLYKSHPFPALDVLYTAGLMNKAPYNNAKSDLKDSRDVSTESSGQPSGLQKEKMLLQQWNGKLIAQALKVPELEVELERAIWQVEEALTTKEELRQEKKSIEAAAVDAEQETKR